jgi:hypothetical protein
MSVYEQERELKPELSYLLTLKSRFEPTNVNIIINIHAQLVFACAFLFACQENFFFFFFFFFIEIIDI